jgi:hypothetical protein
MKISVMMTVYFSVLLSFVLWAYRRMLVNVMIRLDRSRSSSRLVTLTFCHGALFSVIIFTFFLLLFKARVNIVYISILFFSVSEQSENETLC